MSKDIVSFDFYITKAVEDKETGEKRWACVSSDTGTDLYDDDMTLELYKSFLAKIDRNEAIHESMQTDFWKGGMPYLSISHYSDGNGVSVPGEITSVYIDGNKLKAKGIFHDTPLGNACFDAVKESISVSKNDTEYNPVRISIGFIDLKHKHKSDDSIFVRGNLEDICPVCVEKFLEDGKITGNVYLEGQLIHLALTRVPVNPRTLMEVDKSMTTRKEDAESIVGAELADEIEETEKELATSMKALVTKAEDSKEDEDEMDEKEKKKKDEEKEKAHYSETLIEGMEELTELVKSLVSTSVEKAEVTETVDPHFLDPVLSKFKSRFDEIDKSNADNLSELSEVWDEFADTVKSQFGVEEQELGDVAELVKSQVDSAVQKAVSPLLEKVDMLLEKSKAPEAEPTVQRGITGTPNITVNNPAQHPAKEAPKGSIRDLVNKSMGRG